MFCRVRSTVLRFVPWRRKKAKLEKLSESCVPRMGKAITRLAKTSVTPLTDLSWWSSIQIFENIRFTERRSNRGTEECQIQNDVLATREPLCEERITRPNFQRSRCQSRSMASHSDWTTMQAQKAIGKVDDFLASKIRSQIQFEKAVFDSRRRLFFC